MRRFGIPDEEFGERLCAHIEGEFELRSTIEVIRAILGERLARFKVPKVIEFAASLSREDSGKIFKRKLRAPYWENSGR